jgi:hypothetical protein
MAQVVLQVGSAEFKPSTTKKKKTAHMHTQDWLHNFHALVQMKMWDPFLKDY